MRRTIMERIHDEAVEALEAAKSNPYDIDGAKIGLTCT
jgi:hypothetical protein